MTAGIAFIFQAQLEYRQAKLPKHYMVNDENKLHLGSLLSNNINKKNILII